MVITTAFEEPVGDETAEWHQSIGFDYDYLQIIESSWGSYASSIFENVPRRCRSKRLILKKNAKVLDSGIEKLGTTQEYKSTNHSVAVPRGPRRKRGKPIADSWIEKLGTVQEYKCTNRSIAIQHGPRKRRVEPIVDSCNAELNFQCFRVRGQTRGPLNSSMQGKLDSKTFEDYMRYIWNASSGENRNSFQYLDSLWFTLYSQKLYKEKVLNWVKKKDIFSKKYVLIPIVMWSHWSLLILCNFDESMQSQSKTPCMLLLDSLQTTNPRRLEPGIRKFILDIYSIHQRPGNKASIRKIPLLVPKVPQQRNGEECGSFVLYYISLFLENAPGDFCYSEGYPYFMKEDWFTPEEFDDFCKKLEVDSNTNNSLSSDE